MSGSMLMMAAVAGAEILLLVLVVLLVAVIRNRARQKRDNKAIQGLLTRIRQGKAEREKVIEQFLSSGMQLTGEELTQKKVAMLRAELLLLQRFAAVYKRREAGSAARFDLDVVEAIAPYHTLAGEGLASTDGVADDGAGEGELEELRRENKRLSDELKITMETMSRMLNEYSTMFAGGSVADVAPLTATAGAAVAAPAPAGGEEASVEVEIAAESESAEADVEAAADTTAAVDDESGSVELVTEAVEDGQGEPIVELGADQLDVGLDAADMDVLAAGPDAGMEESLPDETDAEAAVVAGETEVGEEQPDAGQGGETEAGEIEAAVQVGESGAAPSTDKLSDGVDEDEAAPVESAESVVESLTSEPAEEMAVETNGDMETGDDIAPSPETGTETDVAHVLELGPADEAELNEAEAAPVAVPVLGEEELVALTGGGESEAGEEDHKGDDVEAVASLLEEGEVAFLGEEEVAENALDDIEDLFDPALDEPEGEGVEALDAQDDIDDLFDAAAKPPRQSGSGG